MKEEWITVTMILNDIRAAVSILESAFKIVTENELLDNFPFEWSCRLKYCHKHNTLTRWYSGRGFCQQIERSLFWILHRHNGNFSGHKKWIFEAPPDQVVIWYPKRTVFIFKFHIPGAVCRLHKTESEIIVSQGVVSECCPMIRGI